MPIDASATARDRLLAAALLLLGAALRFWGLGDHSQWYDEMLVTVQASFPLSYILDLCSRVEVHPPFYYLLNKALQALSPSDLMLRLPSALAGTASLALMGLLGARLGALAGRARAAGFFTLALACANPMHIWISRQARPYALMEFFGCLGLLALLRLLDGSGRGSVGRLILANLPVALLHYLGLFFAASQGAALLAARAMGPGTLRLRDILLFALGSLVSFAPVLVFLVSVKWVHANAFLRAGEGLAASLSKVSGTLAQFLCFGYFEPGLACVPPLLGVAAGVACVWRADRRVGAACAALLAAFPLLLLGVGYAAHFTPVHLSPFLPMVLACLGVAAARLLPGRLARPEAAAALAAGLCCVFLIRDGRAFYQPDHDVVDAWHLQERYKTVARTVAANARPGDFVVVENGFAAQAADWYLRSLFPPSGLERFAVDPEQEAVRLLYFRKSGEPPAPGLVSRFGETLSTPPSPQGAVGNMDVSMLHIPRTGRLAWGPHAPYAGGAFLPDALLAGVRSLRGLRLFAEGDYWLCPARTDVPGEAVFRFESPGDVHTDRVYLLASALLRRPGNALAVDVRFDDSEWTRALTLEQPGQDGPLWASLRPDAPFRALDVRLTLVAGGRLANIIDGPLEQVRVESLAVFLPQESNRFHAPGLEAREQGLEVPAPDGRGGLYRWGLDRGVLRFRLDADGPCTLRWTADSPLPGQRGVVRFNGREAGTLALEAGKGSGELALAGRAGENVVEIEWARANRGEGRFAPQDPRPLAVRFTRLFVEPQTAQAGQALQSNGFGASLLGL